MIELRIHGRGGQGNVVAAYLLATAAFESGRYCQAFPAFGAERRGAPVAAFVRIDEQPILRRDAVRTPAFLIVQDAGLLHDAHITDGLRPGGAILVNADPGAPMLAGQSETVVALPASTKAQEIVGRPVPNVALLAAFLTLTDMLPIEALERAVRGRFHGDILERNLQLMQWAVMSVPAGDWREDDRAASA